MHQESRHLSWWHSSTLLLEIDLYHPAASVPLPQLKMLHTRSFGNWIYFKSINLSHLYPSWFLQIRTSEKKKTTPTFTSLMDLWENSTPSSNQSTKLPWLWNLHLKMKQALCVWFILAPSYIHFGGLPNQQGSKCITICKYVMCIRILIYA